MLTCCERIVHEYLMQEMCDRRPPRGKFDLFAVEGGTAAMCYIFDSLIINGMLKKGDTIALATPVFTPYLEMPHLERYQFKVVFIAATEMAKAGYHTWQYPDAEIDKLANPKIKAAFFVNPGNPSSVAMRAGTLRRLVRLVKTRRPILTARTVATLVRRARRSTLNDRSILLHSKIKAWIIGVLIPAIVLLTCEGKSC
jgi:aspartate 4-decarboxylase